MTKAQHTPGLLAAKGTEIVKRHSGGGYTIIARVVGDIFEEGNCLCAIAQLFAAAPELLEALQGMLEVFADGEDDMETVNLARAAIAKAEGLV